MEEMPDSVLGVAFAYLRIDMFTGVRIIASSAQLALFLGNRIDHARVLEALRLDHATEILVMTTSL